jgi:ATP-dependent helicase HepA
VTRNTYADLCISVQALRRYSEGIRTPLAPAIGVAASIYAHQLANVHRVLTDIRIRHLLADEVGLGKTVQALMVLNALRYERPKLRALAIVPDALVTQWRDEILTRAHSAPYDDNEIKGNGQYIRLAWEAQLRGGGSDEDSQFALSDIDPKRFDVLIVDELHRLRADLQDRIVRSAPEFGHVLLLTATPAFQRTARHAQMFSILEPERTAISRSRVAGSERGLEEQLSLGDPLSRWPDWAATAVVNEILDRDRAAAESAAPTELTSAALTHCAYRRVIRTRRTDYSGILPQRRHRPLIVEPLEVETERQRLVWNYFDFLGDLSRRFDPILLAKRVILSPPSLEQRIDFLRRQGHEREGLLERVKPLVAQSNGDSRVDALVDLLADIWSTDPSERILVAAQDNLTVDYLFNIVRTRLPLVGPLLARVPLVVARVRQGMATDAVEDIAGYGNETNENVEEFQRGSAQILIAPEVAQVGLNLQCARILVLYSVPWRPEEVEQWIGRLDRIGNVAAFASDDAARTIDVYTIAQRGLVDERVVSVLQHFHVFERSVNLDGDHLEEVAGLIESAALGADGVRWQQLEDESEVMASEDEVKELVSPLRPHLPWTVHQATNLKKYIEGLAPAVPVLVELPPHFQSGPRAWDRAFEGMTRLLGVAGEYNVRTNTDHDGSRFQSLWYRFGDRETHGRREVLSKVVFTFGADPEVERSPRHAFAFITRRGDIGAQPRRDVTMLLENQRVRRPLRFLSFGDSLHDELVSGWMPGKVAPIDVEMFQDHSLWKFATTPSVYLIRVWILDPAAALNRKFTRERVESAIADAATQVAAERLPELIHPIARLARCALDADVRWIRSVMPASLDLEVRKRQGSQWIAAGAEESRILLNPMAHGRQGVPKSSKWLVSSEERVSMESEFKRLRERDLTTARSSWGHRLPEFESAMNMRACVLRQEAEDSIGLAESQLQSAEEALRAVHETANRAQITRAENLRNMAADTLRATKALWEQRELWLSECATQILDVVPDEYVITALRVRRAQ